MKPLRVLSLFSGIGGLDLAAEWAGMQIVGQVEIDSYCQRVLARHWPAVKRAADVREVWGDAFGAVDVIVGGFPCFVAGTLILTRSGYRPIESLQIGDEVLTHLGRWRPVTAVMQREGAPLRHIQATGVDVVTTDEHPFYARTYGRRWVNSVRNYTREWTAPEWVDAAKLEAGSFVGQVLPVEREDSHTEAFWWLVGRYLADGWRVERKSRAADLEHPNLRGRNKGAPPKGRVVICCARYEAEELARRIADAGYIASRCDEQTVTKFHITRTDLYDFLGQFGRYAHGKVIPACALELDAAKARALLDGYLSGDGYRDAGSNDRRATTASRALALGVALLAQRAYGVVAAMRRCHMKPKTNIQGRDVAQRDFYVISIPDRNRSAMVEGEYGWKRVRTNEPMGRGTVYNIAVADDESYVAEGAIVHNCQPTSVAGKRRGSADDRWLWPEYLRLIQVYRPTWIVAENVPGLISSELDGVLRDLDAEGYAWQTLVYPASAVGAPHIRERVFIVAHAKGSSRANEQSITDAGRPMERTSASASSGTERRDSAEGTTQHQRIERDSSPDMADAAERGIRCGRASRITGQPAQSDQGDVADASGPGREEWHTPTEPDDAGHATRRDTEDVADATCERQHRTGRARRRRPEPTDGSSGRAQSRMGREHHGLPAGLDGHRWPAGPGQAQYEWEAPRTTQERIPNRAARLKALGNAVVPQQAYPIFAAIAAVEAGLADEGAA